MNDKQFDLLLDQFKQLNNSIGEIATHLTPGTVADLVPDGEEGSEDRVRITVPRFLDGVLAYAIPVDQVKKA